MTARVSRLVRAMDAHDQAILLGWTLRRRPATLQLMRAVTHCGDAIVVIAITALLLALANGALHDAARIAGFTLALSHGLVQLLKRSVNRARPALPRGACLIDAPDRFSFPSGHAAAALSLTLPLVAIAPPPIAIALFGLGVLVGLSRCYLGVHYPGDVLIGWALAAGSCAVAPAALRALALL